MTPHHPLILFDGVCNLCHFAVNWVIDRDSKAIFRFASLQSEVAGEALRRAGFAGALPDSVVLIDGDGVHVRSAAAMRIARRLGFPWSMAAVGSVLPAFVRDAIYRWIARNRYAWFGRTASCRMPSKELAGRFLDSGELSGSADAP